MRELSELFDKAVEDGTFNLDAVERIAELRKKVATLEDEGDRLSREVDRLTDTNDRLVEDWRSEQEKVQAFVAREGELTEREKKVTELEVRLEMHEKQSQAYHDLLQGLTRNTLFRRQVYSNDTVPDPNSGYSGATMSQTRSTSVEDREE